MAVHEINITHDDFQDIWWNRRTFELCRVDKNYQVGDTLVYHDYNEETGKAAGMQCMRRVVSILQGPHEGLSEGFIIASIKPL